METQKTAILNELSTGVRLTALEALKLCGCLNLRNRISELRREGFQIDDKWKAIKTKYGKKLIKEYFMKVKK